MEKLFVLLGAIALVILGARGTYKAVWNQFFPNEPIVTTPTSTVGQTGSSSSSGGSAYNPKGGQPGQTPTTPVQVGQQAGNVTKSILSGLAGNSGSNTAHVVPGPGGVYPVTSVPIAPTYTAPAPSTAPSWWPSWLPYPGDVWARG